MPEPFKNLMSKTVIEDMAKHFANAWPDFDSRKFTAAATNDLESLELKARTEQVTRSMIQHFPGDFKKSRNIILDSLGAPIGDNISADKTDRTGITGWAIMPIADYVGLCGQKHFSLSMSLLKELTKRSSSEFGIRYFLEESQDKTMSVIKTWTKDSDHHVRRLASEGIRPRLPWAKQLPFFKKDPLPVIEILEKLKDDVSEYVRRSVANNLNDISKDHPDLVVSVAKEWMKDADKERTRIVRHACRTLVKSGNKKALRVLGFKAPKIKQIKISVSTAKVKFGSSLEFELSMRSDSTRSQDLLIDYIIHHRKSNGGTSPKVFKWRRMKLAAGKENRSCKKHAIRKITTRVYYPGKHEIEIMINGILVGSADFQLLM